MDGTKFRYRGGAYRAAMESKGFTMPAPNDSALLSSAALDLLSPSMQACYENAYAKLTRGVSLLPSELEALEYRLLELWDEALPDARHRRVESMNYALAAALHTARKDGHPMGDMIPVLLVMRWLLFAEELRAHPFASSEIVDLAAELSGG